MNKIKLISYENEVIWVEDKNGVVYGIANAFQMLDEDGLNVLDDIDNSPLYIIDQDQNFDCDINYDQKTWESTIYTTCNKKIVFAGNNVNLLDL